LLSDRVNSIGINNTTGEVFFATENGMCSFKNDATKGGEKNENVLVFPNPVPHKYLGTIAIRGLVNNAFVKITDTNGQLIYATKANGGEAIWDGKNLKGEKTATGVYLVFCTNADGTETTVAKILYEK
jgi:ribosomal protein S11